MFHGLKLVEHDVPFLHGQHFGVLVARAHHLLRTAILPVRSNLVRLVVGDFGDATSRALPISHHARHGTIPYSDSRVSKPSHRKHDPLTSINKLSLRLGIRLYMKPQIPYLFRMDFQRESDHSDSDDEMRLLGFFAVHV